VESTDVVANDTPVVECEGVTICNSVAPCEVLDESVACSLKYLSRILRRRRLPKAQGTATAQLNDIKRVLLRQYHTRIRKDLPDGNFCEHLRTPDPNEAINKENGEKSNESLDLTIPPRGCIGLT